MHVAFSVLIGITIALAAWPPGGLWPTEIPRVGTGKAWGAQPACPPTRPDAEGPFYKPNAPERASVGHGLVVAGTVRTVGTCAPIPNARLEWWQANPQGHYDDAHRATHKADGDGRYRFETSFPPPYFGRPSHLHVKVLAPGHRPLTTQVYPQPGQPEIAFDFVLRPE